MKHLDNYPSTPGTEPSPQLAGTLTRRGGVNPMGFPIYRLVQSELVVEKIGGAWHEWDDNLNIADRGGIESGEGGRAQKSHFSPDRVVLEVRDVPKYAHLDDQGWILERWYPASFYGSPQAWESHKVKIADVNGHMTIESSVPQLGPFPAHGQYEMLTGPFTREPSISFLEDFISAWEQRRDSFPEDIEKFIRMRVEAATRKEEERAEGAFQKNYLRIKDSAKPLTSTTLEAGRWRSRMFEKSGHTSHIGN